MQNWITNENRMKSNCDISILANTNIEMHLMMMKAVKKWFGENHLSRL